uniref:AB hydrolase-1 domain-containing protein n=1 Tax=Mycena chlorophos TaxID=658473 RepID=A0ABQ0M7T3_MYCCL|nr:predicted protein [Mycena chlorophos]
MDTEFQVPDEAEEPPNDLTHFLSTFTVYEILGLVTPVSSPSRAERRNRGKLIAFVNRLPPEVKRAIIQHAGAQTGSKRIAAGTVPTQRPAKRRRLEPVDEILTNAVHSGDLETLIDGPFLRCVSEETIAACISGNSALAKGTCMVCARRLFVTELEQCKPDDIPNLHLLSPTHPHPAQFLYRGSLLHARAVSAPVQFVCSQCHSQLLKFERPPLSLSNNMWIGDVPFALSILTLPERILIGIHFPAAYIVKLFPKKGSPGSWDKESINSGLCGNVSTYHLNTSAISDMVTGNILPRPVGLLAAVIAVTFVGARNIPLFILPDIFEDVVDILDAKGIDKVIAIGHDWGVRVVSRLINYHSDRLLAAAVLAVGYFPPQAVGTDITLALKEKLGYDAFAYQRFFVEPDAHLLMEKNFDSFFSLLFPLPKSETQPEDLWLDYMCVEGKTKEWIEANRTTELVSYLSTEDKEYVKKSLLDGGLQGPLAWYTVLHSGDGAADDAQISNEAAIITKPFLFIAFNDDPICRPAVGNATHAAYVQPQSNLTTRAVDGDHWALISNAEEVNKALLGWIEGLSVAE